MTCTENKSLTKSSTFIFLKVLSDYLFHLESIHWHYDVCFCLVVI